VPFAPADAAGFEALVAEGRAGRLRGLNVTAPFKEQAWPWPTSASEAAAAPARPICWSSRDGHDRCDSTDGFGMMWAFKDQAPGLGVKDRPVVILGAGGAARAAAGTLIGRGAQVRILNRTARSGRSPGRRSGAAVSVVDEATGFRGAALIINALSIPPTLDLAPCDADAGHGHDLSSL
jgi:shikimate dehydrogenase